MGTGTLDNLAAQKMFRPSEESRAQFKPVGHQQWSRGSRTADKLVKYPSKTVSGSESREMSNLIALVSLDFSGAGSMCGIDKGVETDGRAVSRGDDSQKSNYLARI
jgi:hypothetical protein